MSFLLPKAPRPFSPPTLAYRILYHPLTTLAQLLYSILLFLRGPALTPPSPPPPSPPHGQSQSQSPRRIRLVCISDTHTHKPLHLPPGDVLIHAGDLTNDGSAAAIQDQLDWLASLRAYKYVVVIAGNHDSYFDPRARRHEDRDTVLRFEDHVRYLQHESVRLEFPVREEGKGEEEGGGAADGSSGSAVDAAGTKTISNGTTNRGAAAATGRSGETRSLLFHGSPQIPACGPASFAFQYPRHTDAWTGTIPPETDVLITHTPPRHHLDLPQGHGCEFLLRETWRVRPPVHICGHVHAGYGREAVFWDEAQRAYERICARDPDPDSEQGGGLRGLVGGLWRDGVALVFGAWWVELVRMLVWGVIGFVWRRVWGGDDGERSGGLLVNAALMYRNTGKIGNKAQVVEI